MAVTREYQGWLAELFEPLGPVLLRRMFGGLGIFYNDVMFALAVDDTLYFKVDDENRSSYEAAGEPPFTYQRKDGRASVMSYFRVPVDVMEDGDEFLDWARASINIALRMAKPKPGTRSKLRRAK